MDEKKHFQHKWMQNMKKASVHDDYGTQKKFK